MLLLRGRQGACGTGLVLVACLVASGAAVFCMAGVAVGDVDVAGVALADIDVPFVWQVWHLWHLLALG